jgi:hypothetical protein
MPHELDKYREYLDPLIGPIEELLAKIDAFPPGLKQHPLVGSLLGGLGQAKETLEDTVGDIDNYEEPDPEPEEIETVEVDEEDEDEDEDAEAEA